MGELLDPEDPQADVFVFDAPREGRLARTYSDMLDRLALAVIRHAPGRFALTGALRVARKQPRLVWRAAAVEAVVYAAEKRAGATDEEAKRVASVAMASVLLS